MPKLQILQQLYAIKELVEASFAKSEAEALSFHEHLAILLQRTDLQEIDEKEQVQFLQLLNDAFPTWNISPIQPEPPETVNIAYILQKLDVVRSTFYRSIRDKLLTPSGTIGGSPVYLKKEVDWLGAEAKKLGDGKWVYSKLWKKKKANQGL